MLTLSDTIVLLRPLILLKILIESKTRRSRDEMNIERDEHMALYTNGRICTCKQMVHTTLTL